MLCFGGILWCWLSKIPITSKSVLSSLESCRYFLLFSSRASRSSTQCLSHVVFSFVRAEDIWSTPCCNLKFLILFWIMETIAVFPHWRVPVVPWRRPSQPLHLLLFLCADEVTPPDHSGASQTPSRAPRVQSRHFSDCDFQLCFCLLELALRLLQIRHLWFQELRFNMKAAFFSMCFLNCPLKSAFFFLWHRLLMGLRESAAIRYCSHCLQRSASGSPAACFSKTVCSKHSCSVLREDLKYFSAVRLFCNTWALSESSSFCICIFIYALEKRALLLPNCFLKSATSFCSCISSCSLASSSYCSQKPVVGFPDSRIPQLPSAAGRQHCHSPPLDLFWFFLPSPKPLEQQMADPEHQPPDEQKSSLISPIQSSVRHETIISLLTICKFFLKNMFTPEQCV